VPLDKTKLAVSSDILGLLIWGTETRAGVVSVMVGLGVAVGVDQAVNGLNDRIGEVAPKLGAFADEDLWDVSCGFELVGG
jgi:hypothetical protein